MIEIRDKKLCSGCHSCISICPKKCISMQIDEEGFWYPKVDKNKCINCRLCEMKCPILNGMQVNRKPKAYACYNIDENIRKESSSGGIFTLLASNVIDRGGVVYGASFNEEFEVEHIQISTKQELSKLRGSKYVQSKIGNSYNEIKILLNDGKLVYFSGTPCQIDGLICFLGKKYDNLICQDIICHGVPSTRIWKDYIDIKNKCYEDKPLRINFRQKDSGWELFELSLQYKNSSYSCCHKEDPFMKAFLSDLILRPSCYDCHSKSLNRNSDITLADFWGIKEIYPDFYDDGGISLVFINSKKGWELFENIINEIEYRKCNINEAIKYNQSSYKSVKKPKNREKFIKECKNSSFENIVNKYTKLSLIRKIKITIKNIIKKLINVQ